MLDDRGAGDASSLTEPARAPDTVAHEQRLRARTNRAAIVAMVAAMACFLVNDTLVKVASQTLPAAQLIFVRGVLAVALVLCVAAASGASVRLRVIARGWIAARAVIDGIAAMLFLVSLFHLPISSATAINMTSPLIITMLAAIFIGERIGLAIWLATAVGFVGVVLIVQPRVDDFGGYALVCLVAAVLMSVRDLITRRVHDAIPSILVTLSNTVVVTLLAGAILFAEGWAPIGVADIALLAVAAVFLSSGYFLIVTSTRRGDLSVVAPFRYSGLLFATISGFVVWGEFPNALAWCGVVLLVGSGVHVLRSNRRARAADPAPD